MGYDIVTMEDCASNYGTFKVPGSKGAEYVVTMNGSEGMPHCTCKAYDFAPWDAKDCKHIRQVWEEACLYNPQWRDGKSDPKLRPASTDTPLPDSKCPACGGPTIAVRRAV
jgi:hypothetical protein